MEDHLWVLKDRERDLIRELDPDRMHALDEDDLLALHRRIRRARNKHTTNYRRKAAVDVVEVGARGAAHPKGGKSRLRAEVFEEALSLVSARLAAVAHEQAEELKRERLERARSARSAGPEPHGPDSDGKVPDSGRLREHSKHSGQLKRDASSIAQGARRQAKRDS